MLENVFQKLVSVNDRVVSYQTWKASNLMICVNSKLSLALQ